MCSLFYQCDRKNPIRDGYDSGQNYGAVASLYSLVTDKIITLDEAIERSSLSKEEFMNIVNQK